MTGQPRPLAQMTEHELLAEGRSLLRQVVRSPVGTVQRALMWRRFDFVMAELDRRAAAHVLKRIWEKP